MLENFIDDNYLKKFHPNLTYHLWSDQADYQTQRDKAFDMLINDLWNRGIDPKLCMPTNDLKGLTTDDNNTPLHSDTITSATTGSVFEGFNERRFVVKATAVTGTWTVKLQGNNATDEPSGSDARWEDVTSASLSVSSTGTSSVTFTKQYRWYRYYASGGTSLTFGAYLTETLFDDIIAYGALKLIFSDFAVVNPDGGWALIRDESETMYNKLLENIKFNYDSDEDGRADDSDESMKAQVRMSR